MIAIAKKDIKLKDLRKEMDGFRYMLPKKRVHYPETIVFARGHSYNIKLNESSWTIQTEAGIMFFAQDSGPVIPGFFRVFTK